MTREQKIEAYQMLLDGYTLQAIGEKFGISRQRVLQLFSVKHIRTDAAIESCAYPNIAKWMDENGYGYTGIAKLCNAPYASVFSALKECKDCKKSFIDKILKLTGMTYEVAFQTNQDLEESE